MIDGIKFHCSTYAKAKLFLIDHLSDEFKNVIRNNLSIISYGQSMVEEDDTGIYDYKNTLCEFLKRYDSKADDTKKGMMGELISNVLIRYYEGKLSCISVFFNKEERNIKKGYDIVYHSNEDNSIWYSEVKSGTNNSKKKPDDATRELLDRANKDISDKFTEKRRTLWDSAIVDAGMVINDSKKSKNIKNLLSKDLLENINLSKTRYKAVLISVLFYDIQNVADHNVIVSYCQDIEKEKKFEDILVFSIQKNTYTEIEKFLRSENDC